MRFSKLFILGGLLAAGPGIPLPAQISAKEVIVDYGKIDELDSLKTEIIRKMGEGDYRRLNAMKALIEMNKSTERVPGPFGEERVVRFESVANYLQEAGIFELKLDTGGYRLEWSEEAKRFLENKGYTPENVGRGIIERWQKDQPIGMPYYGIFKIMAEQVAETKNPEEDAEILIRKAGENYVIMAEAIGCINMHAYFGNKDGVVDNIGWYNQANQGDFPYIVFKGDSSILLVNEQPKDLVKQPKPPPEQKPTKPQPQGGKKPTTEKGQQVKKDKEEVVEQPQPQEPVDTVSVFWGNSENAFNKKNYAEAIEHYETAKKAREEKLREYGVRPNADPLALYFEGCIKLCRGIKTQATDSSTYAEKKDLYEKAISYFSSVLEKPNPYSEWAMQKKGVCEANLKKLQESIWGKKERADSLFVNAYHSADPEKAFGTFKEALKIYLELKKEYGKMKNAEKEKEMHGLVEKALEGMEKKLQDVMLLVNNAEKQGEYEKAIRYYEKVIEGYFEIAKAYKDIGENENADLSEGMIVKVLINMGYVAERAEIEGRYGEAVKYYEKLAEVYSKLAKWTEKPDNKKYYKEQTKKYKEQGDKVKEKQRKFNTAEEKKQHANSLIDEAKYFEAIEILEEAKKLFVELGAGDKVDECDDLITLAKEKNIEKMYERIVEGTGTTLGGYLIQQGIDKGEWKKIVERIGKEGINENGAIKREYLEKIFGQHYHEKGMEAMQKGSKEDALEYFYKAQKFGVDEKESIERAELAEYHDVLELIEKYPNASAEFDKLPIEDKKYVLKSIADGVRKLMGSGVILTDKDLVELINAQLRNKK